jgi:hypothetical protein
MNKNILIAILVVIIVGIAAFMVFSSTTPAQKVDTEFNLLTDNSLSDGDQFQFQLRELNGSAIAGEKVQIGLTDSAGNVEVYDVVTDSNGKGAIVIENEDSGTHDLTLSYAGNDKFKECGIKLNITVDDGSSDSDDDSTQDVSDDNSVSSNDPSSSNSTTPDNPEHVNYDPEHHTYYLDDGTIVGDSQWSGANYYELQKRGDDWFAGIS